MNAQPPLSGFAISGALAYFDTVQMWILRRLEQWERDTLESLCGALADLSPSIKSNAWMLRNGYRSRLLMHQPKAEALRFIQQRVDAEACPHINRVDCA